MLLIMFILTALYLIIIYVIFAEQQRSLRPAQNMSMNFMQLSINLDVMITSALLVKT